MLEIIIGLSVYLLSFFTILLLDYIYKKTITVQDIFIGLIPVINTIALLLGTVKLFSMWYKLNKNKVLIKRVPKPKKPKKPALPKVPKGAKVPNVEAFTIPAPKK